MRISFEVSASDANLLRSLHHPSRGYYKCIPCKLACCPLQSPQWGTLLWARRIPGKSWGITEMRRQVEKCCLNLRSPRTERLQVLVRKMCQMISSLRRAEGLWLQNEVQFSESWRFWGSHHHDDARDLQVRILGLEPAPPFCEHLCDLPGSCRTEFGLGGGHFP